MFNWMKTGGVYVLNAHTKEATFTKREKKERERASANTNHKHIIQPDTEMGKL